LASLNREIDGSLNQITFSYLLLLFLFLDSDFLHSHSL